MVMHKTQRRVMLKFLKQHEGVWRKARDPLRCDLCYCTLSKDTAAPITLASYIAKPFPGGGDPYTDSPPMLCDTHARELGLIW
jgi:hypothetical protein